jgi:anti-sigma regulatory factor (Ser/Thr protein kinase)
MQFTLTTCYRNEFLPPVIDFIAGLARTLGASDKEVFDLSIASEEAGAYIIARYPDNGFAEQFEVICEVTGDGLQVVFSNMGLPIDPRALPRYTVEQPEETIDGLGLFLIEKLLDRFEFVNQGRKGWRSVLYKRFAAPTTLADQHAANADDLAAGRERLQIQVAEARHVAGIVELAYRNYRYSYSKAIFYYPEKLQRAIDSGEVIAYVAVTAEDRVVGQMAMLRPPNAAGVVELGALMVQPEFRRSKGLLQLIKAVTRGARELGEEAVMGEANLVTSHTQSQKIGALFAFAPMALKLAVHDRARFMQLTEESDGQRETLLHTVLVNQPLPPITLFAPVEHHAITRRLFKNAGITIELASCDKQSPPPLTQWRKERHEEDAYSILSITQPGADLTTVLRQQLYELESDGMKTVYIRMAGWQWQPTTLGSDLRAQRLFFSGWVVATPQQWWLQYTRLFGQRFDFNCIQLCDPVAVELRDYIAGCYQEAALA